MMRRVFWALSGHHRRRYDQDGEGDDATMHILSRNVALGLPDPSRTQPTSLEPEEEEMKFEG